MLSLLRARRRAQRLRRLLLALDSLAERERRPQERRRSIGLTLHGERT